MPRVSKKETTFYKKKLQGLINHLKKMNSLEINTYINEHYNELDILNDKDIGVIIRIKYHVNNRHTKDKDNCVYSKEVEQVPSRYRSEDNRLYKFMHGVALIIYEDDSLSNIRFIQYLDKNSISVIIGNLLRKFHKKCFQVAYEKRTTKDLEKVFYFKYLECSLKKDIARIICERLAVKKGTSKLELWKWTFNSKIEVHKIKYLHSIRDDVIERMYLDLLLLCIREGSRRDIELYIYSYLLEKGELKNHLDLMKKAFQENIRNSQSGKKYFDLLFEYVKSNEDIKTLKWMCSIYKQNNPRQDNGLRLNGKKATEEYLESLMA